MKRWEIPQFRKKTVSSVEESHDWVIRATVVAVEHKVVVKVNSITDFAKVYTYSALEKARDNTGVPHYCISDQKKAKRRSYKTI